MSYIPAVQGRGESRSANKNLFLFAGAVAIATFAIDVMTPRGFAAGVFPYFLFMLISLWLPGRASFMFAALASALALLGYLQSSGGVPWLALADRGLIVGAFWVMAVVIYLRQAEERAAADDPAPLARFAAPVDAGAAAAAAKAEMLAAVNHELRQPLQATGLLAAGLLEDTRDPARRQTVEEIARAVRRMGCLLDDFCAGFEPCTASPGAGASFMVPARLAGVDRPARPGGTADLPAAPDLGGLSVVLIEDNALARKAMLNLLERWGAAVVAAETGAQALEALSLSATAPDAIVTDYRLPEHETGVDVVGRLRRRLGWQVPAIVVTGDVSSAVRRDVEAADCVFVEKPVEPARLRGLIHDLVAERPAVG